MNIKKLFETAGYETRSHSHHNGNHCLGVNIDAGESIVFVVANVFLEAYENEVGWDSFHELARLLKTARQDSLVIYFPEIPYSV